MQSERLLSRAPDANDLDAMIEADRRREQRVADLMFQPLRSIAIGALYGVACLMLGVEPWKAALVALIILMSLMLDLGRRMIMRFGLVFIPYAIGVWLGLLPDPVALRAAVCSVGAR